MTIKIKINKSEYNFFLEYLKNVINRYGQNYKIQHQIDGTFEKGFCNIDLEEYEKVFKTHCGHTFLYENLLKWFEKNNTCPYCREQLRIYIKICY